MIYVDPLYGRFEISEPVVLELIKSPPLQRLKGVDQAGYPKPFFPGLKQRNRFDHSIGVLLLLNKFGASLDEQLSGLIHDVSHSCFSHVVDYSLDLGTQRDQSHQDAILDKFIKKTKIPHILTRYGYDVNYLLEDGNFPLKERSLPGICADRLDYSLRDAFALGELSEKGVRYFLDNLITLDSSWVFTNFESAERFANFFFQMNNYYSGFPSALMFATTGDYLRYALQKEYISKDNLWTRDQEVLLIIAKYLKSDKKLRMLFNRMNNKTKIINDPKKYDVKIYVKSRVVDPLYLDTNKNIVSLSDTKKDWEEVLKQGLKPKVYFLRYVV